MGKNVLSWEEWVMPFEGFCISLRDGEKPAVGCEEVGCQFEKERQVRQWTWQEAHLAGAGEVEQDLWTVPRERLEQVQAQSGRRVRAED